MAINVVDPIFSFPILLILNIFVNAPFFLPWSPFALCTPTFFSSSIRPMPSLHFVRQAPPAGAPPGGAPPGGPPPPNFGQIPLPPGMTLDQFENLQYHLISIALCVAVAFALVCWD
jgi:hypothetical protein